MKFRSWATIQRMFVFESADFKSLLWLEEVSCCGIGELVLIKGELRSLVACRRKYLS